MTNVRRAVGDYGEALACRYLTEHGFEVLERNWRCVRGEIDIVAAEGDVLVVVEVKTRRSDTFGEPFEAVGRRKAMRLRSLAHLWLEAARADQPDGLHPRRWYSGLRIDVVSIKCARLGAPVRIEHLFGVA